MIKIEYPDHDFKVKQEGNVKLVFDEIRRAWLKLTPEEWVRQNFVQYLIKVKNFPSTLIALEKQIRVGEMLKRFDILIYDTDHTPWMMIECKAMQVSLKEEILDQVLRYNAGVPVKYMVITNGTGCMAFEKRNLQLVPLNEFPVFEQ